VNIPQNVGRNEHYNNKFIHKVKQRWHWNPFGHIGDEISKKKHWASMGLDTQFNNNFGVKLSLSYPFFS